MPTVHRPPIRLRTNGDDKFQSAILLYAAERLLRSRPPGVAPVQQVSVGRISP